MRDRCDVWLKGEMICLKCGQNGKVHVWLEGSEPVECEECGEFACVPSESGSEGGETQEDRWH